MIVAYVVRLMLVTWVLFVFKALVVAHGRDIILCYFFKCKGLIAKLIMEAHTYSTVLECVLFCISCFHHVFLTTVFYEIGIYYRPMYIQVLSPPECFSPLSQYEPYSFVAVSSVVHGDQSLITQTGGYKMGKLQL